MYLLFLLATDVLLVSLNAWPTYITYEETVLNGLAIGPLKFTALQLQSLIANPIKATD